MIHGLPPREQLEEHDAEAIDVALVRELASHGVLGRVVAEGAEHLGGVQPGGGVGGLVAEVEVGDLAHVAAEDEHVAGPHVAVDHGRLGLLVEVLQPLRRPEGHPGPLGPRQRRPAGPLLMLPAGAALLPVEDVVEGALGGELVERDPVVELQAVAQQLGEVLALEPRHHRQLRAELGLRLPGPAVVEHLHGHGGRLPRAAIQLRAVHAPVGAFPDKGPAAEVARRTVQLRQRHGRHVDRQHLGWPDAVPRRVRPSRLRCHGHIDPRISIAVFRTRKSTVIKMNIMRE